MKFKLRRKYAGINGHRLQDNFLEAQFAAAWQRMNESAAGPEEGADTLDYILWQGDQRFVEPCSERDRLIANTIIQWLGSPVGVGFISNVLSVLDTENDGAHEVVDPAEIEITDSEGT